MKGYKDFMDYTREEWNTKFFYKVRRLFICLLGFTALAMIFYYTGLMLPAFLMFTMGMVFTGALLLATAFWYMDKYVEYKKGAK